MKIYRSINQAAEANPGLPPTVESLSLEDCDKLYLDYLEIFNVAPHHAPSGCMVDSSGNSTTLVGKSMRGLPAPTLSITPDTENGEQVLRISRNRFEEFIDNGCEYREVRYNSILYRNSCRLVTRAIERRYDYSLVEKVMASPFEEAIEVIYPESRSLDREAVTILQRMSGDTQTSSFGRNAVISAAKNIGKLTHGLIAKKS